MNLKVVNINGDVLEFENGVRLYSDHAQDCCEHHYLCLEDLTMEDFDGLEFDLSSDDFFNRIEDYGIELIPVKGHSVKIPGYGYNNGYYSSNIDLVVTDGKITKIYDVSECQKIAD